jgi:uncharacterized protein (DUF58 family)
MESFETVVLKAKEDVYTHLQGSNFSQILGQGYDFAELRSYDSSDDIRSISWINSAKSNELYVKKMHEEREFLVQVTMLVDGRAVIGEKQHLMLYLLSLLAYSSFQMGNLFQASFALGSAFKSFEATKEIEAIENILNNFAKVKPLGLVLEPNRVVEKLVKREHQKSLFFLVGDFFEEVDLSVLAQQHELCVIIVRKRWEENPHVDIEAELVNPLSGRTINKTVSNKALKHYREKLKAHDEKLYTHFRQHQIKYTKIYEISEVFEKFERLYNP